MVLQKTLEIKLLKNHKNRKTQFLSQYYDFGVICVDILRVFLKIKLVSNTFLSGIRSGTKQVAYLEHFSTAIPQTYLKSRA